MFDLSDRTSVTHPAVPMKSKWKQIQHAPIMSTDNDNNNNTLDAMIMTTKAQLRLRLQQCHGSSLMVIAICLLLGNVQSLCPRMTTLGSRNTLTLPSLMSTQQRSQQQFSRYNCWSLAAATSPGHRSSNANEKNDGLKLRFMLWKRNQQTKEQRHYQISPPANQRPQHQQQQQQQQPRFTFLQIRMLSKFFSAGWKQFRRSTLVLSMAAFIWMSSLSMSHASTTTTTTSTTASSNNPTIISKIVPSSTRADASLDRLVQRYIQDYMFADDIYDPLESAFREAYDDVTKGTYPRQLSEVTSSVLGQSGSTMVGTTTTTTTSSSSSSGSSMSEGTEDRVGRWLLQTIRMFQRRFGVSETTAINIMAAIFVVAGPCIFLFFGMIVGGMSKRQINRIMKQRYGDTYT